MVCVSVRARLVILAAVVAAAVRGAGAIDVVKTAGEENPSLVLVSFEGSDTVRTRLLDTLKRCDWFSVQASAQNPDYTLAGRHTGGAQEVLDLQVVARRGATVKAGGAEAGGGTRFTVRGAAPSGRVDEAVYRAVDEVLRKVFGIPGLCNSRIAFAVAGAGNLKEIYTCRFDGTDMQRLTHNGSISTEPAWGGAGQVLVYTLYQNNATSVVLADVANGRQKRLSRFPGLNAGADLSPDGEWAAITLSKDRRVDLFLISARTGQVARQLTNDLDVESSPCWSPNGDRICFVSDRAGKPQLFVISAGGGSVSRLLREAGETVSPDWSPVSNQICFSVKAGGQYAVGVVDMNESRRQRRIVTNAAGSWESPSWAPDGRHLVCSRRSGPRNELYMVDTWHGRLIPITQGGNHSLPSWSSVLP